MRAKATNEDVLQFANNQKASNVLKISILTDKSSYVLTSQLTTSRKTLNMRSYIILKNKSQEIRRERGNLFLFLMKLFVTKPDDNLHTCKLRVCKFPNNFRGLLVLDLEPKDMYRCHPYHFMEICIPSVYRYADYHQVLSRIAS